MAVRPVTLNLPDPLYEQLRRRAEQTERTVEAELLEVVAAAVPAAGELPASLAEALAPLDLLDDDALWRAARSRLPAPAAERLADLHVQRQRASLALAEIDELAALVRQYEQAMLVRARTAAILGQRGHDVSSLLNPFVI
jgi:plasmid stability protein